MKGPPAAALHLSEVERQDFLLRLTDVLRGHDARRRVHPCPRVARGERRHRDQRDAPAFHARPAGHEAGGPDRVGAAGDKQQARQAGFHMRLTKPVSPDSLTEAIAICDR